MPKYTIAIIILIGRFTQNNSQITTVLLQISNMQLLLNKAPKTTFN